MCTTRPSGPPAYACRIAEMKADQFAELTTLELLQAHANVIAELRRRGVLRTKSNPVGDYAEWLVSNSLGLTLEGNSAAGYDATDAKGVRYQIKARRVTPDNKSRQLSAIRNLESADFDVLIGVLFDADFSVTGAYQVPHAVIGEYAKYRSHTNAHIVHLRGGLLNDDRVVEITAALASGE